MFNWDRLCISGLSDAETALSALSTFMKRLFEKDWTVCDSSTSACGFCKKSLFFFFF